MKRVSGRKAFNAKKDVIIHDKTNSIKRNPLFDVREVETEFEIKTRRMLAV